MTDDARRRGTRTTPNAIAAIAVDVAVKALGVGGGHASGGGETIGCDELERRVTRLALRKMRSAAAVEMGMEADGISDPMDVGDVVDRSGRSDGTRIDTREIFSASSTENSLHGGRRFARLPRVDSFEGEIKFDSVLPSLDAEISSEDDGRRAPTPGKTRSWLKEADQALPEEAETTRNLRTSENALLQSPKRNGSMTFVTADDDDTRLRLVTTPKTLAPRPRRPDSPSSSPHNTFAEGSQGVSRSTSISSFASAFSPLSRAASKGDFS